MADFRWLSPVVDHLYPRKIPAGTVACGPNTGVTPVVARGAGQHPTTKENGIILIEEDPYPNDHNIAGYQRRWLIETLTENRLIDSRSKC